MSFAVFALLALQDAPQPIVLAPVASDATVESPDWPWINRQETLQCDVSDAAMRRETFTLTLTDEEGFTRAQISGDDRNGLNTTGFVETQLTNPEYLADPGSRRYILFDGANGTAIVVKQGFDQGTLKTTSFTARHTIHSDGIADTEQVMGFCAPASNGYEADQ